MKAYSIFDDFPEEAAKVLSDAGIDLTIHPMGVPRPDPAQMKRILEQYDIVIIGTSQKIYEDMFEKIDTPRIIGTASVGVDHIHVPAEKAGLITVLNTPAANAPSVAEYIVGTLLMTRHRIMEGNELYAQGKDNKKLVRKPEDIHGMTVGFVGAGRISTRVMQLLQPFGVQYICCTDDAPLRQNLVKAYGVRFVSLKELADTADVISVNVPNTETTKGLISSELIATMKSNATLISISREQVVDIPALLKKAEENPNFYAVLDLDVIPEYTGRNNRRNVVITPHIAGGTIESRKRMFNEVADRIVSALQN